jgi:hypothetical protein
MCCTRVSFRPLCRTLATVRNPKSNRGDRPFIHMVQTLSHCAAGAEHAEPQNRAPDITTGKALYFCDHPPYGRANADQVPATLHYRRRVSRASF